MSSSSYRAMAEKAKARAEDKFRSNDVRGARVQALKAQSLFPALPGLAQALTAYNVHLAAATRKLPSGGTDWHAVLDVPPTAGTDAIKKKFKRLCLLTHPDKNPSVAADGAFKLVVRAWDAISSSSSSSAASAAASCESQSSAFESRRRSTRSDSGRDSPTAQKNHRPAGPPPPPTVMLTPAQDRSPADRRRHKNLSTAAAAPRMSCPTACNAAQTPASASRSKEAVSWTSESSAPVARRCTAAIWE
uniref:J domain-containing protein n=1 Tax=Ananas comosus var. bracteatus TaxID=296719 RepID=A0A6V7PFQ0_ANACO|nr:unnamed protein product [Ananas comosus var. bracteatus]